MYDLGQTHKIENACLSKARVAALRTADGKDFAFMLDHSDNHLRMGFVTDIIHRRIDTGVKAVAQKTDAIRLPKECPQCSFLKPPKVTECPSCGFKTKPVADIVVADGELVPLSPQEGQERPVRGTGYLRRSAMVGQLQGLQPWLGQPQVQGNVRQMA